MNGIIADINSDGVSDLILPQNSKYIAFTKHNATQRNLITSITNGMGFYQEIKYKNYDVKNIPNINDNVLSLKHPVNVVSEIMETDGTKTAFDYQNGIVHTEGKGFLGFMKNVAKNEKLNTKITSEYKINPDFFNVNLVKQTLATIADRLVFTMEQTVETKTIDATRTRYIEVVKQEQTTDHLTGLKTKIENLNFDSNWNITKSKTTKGSNTVTVKTTYKSRIAGGAIYLPEDITIAMQNDINSETRKIKYEYNIQNKKTKEITDIGTLNAVTNTYYDFDRWGHATRMHSSANDIIRTSSLEYTNTGYFIKSKTNTLGETTVFDWDETNGLLNSETDHYGRITTYKYNIWEKSEKTVFADGNTQLTTFHWANLKNSIEAKYCIKTEISGCAPVIVWYDALGREIQSDSYGFNKKKISVKTEYNSKGQVYRVSEPYFSNEIPKWASINQYDEYGRPLSTETPFGKTHYTYNGLAGTVKTSEDTTITILNAAGQADRVIKNGKGINYTYFASGLIKEIKPDNSQPVSMEYDLQRNRIRITDPDAGIIRSKYDGFGQLLWTSQKIHIDSDSIKTSYSYFQDGRLKHKNINNVLTDYEYDEHNRLQNIEIEGKHKQSFTYDPFDRVINIKEKIDARILNRKIVYDDFGRVEKDFFPSGYWTANSFDDYGNLIKITDQNSRIIWELTEKTQRDKSYRIKKVIL